MEQSIFLERLLDVALQRTLPGFEQALKRMMDVFQLSAWACLFPPSFSAGGRYLFVAHAINTKAEVFQHVVKHGWEAVGLQDSNNPKRLQHFAADIAPDQTTKWKVIQLFRGKQSAFTMFLFRPVLAPEFSNQELEAIALVGRQVDRSFLFLASQQEQEFIIGLFKLVSDLHPEGLCVLDNRQRVLFENRKFREHMLMWNEGRDALGMRNVPKQTVFPEIWLQTCGEAFEAFHKSTFSPTTRMAVSQGPLFNLQQKISATETLQGAVRYIAFQNSLGVMPYLLLNSTLHVSHARRSQPLSRLALQSGFSPREMEVARLVLDGASAAQIAAELNVALPTIKTHIRHILHKAGVKTRLQLVGLCHKG